MTKASKTYKAKGLGAIIELILLMLSSTSKHPL